MSENHKWMNIRLNDLGEEDNQDQDRPHVEAEIEAAGSAIEIRVKGYGTREEADECGTPVVIEFYEGHLRVLVWNDINQGDPTIIDMEEARLTKRNEEA